MIKHCWAVSLSVSLLNAAPAFAGAVRNPDTFIFGAIGEVTSLDPAFAYDAVSQGLIFNVYETLLAFEGEGNDKIIPLLAAQVPSRKNGLISQDGRTYTFPIRKGVLFQDGSPMTPEDVRYSMLRFMLVDRAGGPSSLLLEPILGLSGTRDASGKHVVDFKQAEQAVRVEGDKVVIRLKDPFGPFLSIMARWSYVMSKPWAVKNRDWDGREETWKAFNDPEKTKSFFYERMNGTGPFFLERWDRLGRNVVLGRNDKYWRKPAFFKRILIRSVPEFTTRKLMLQAGDADLIEVPRPFITQLKGMEGVRAADGLPRLMTDPAFFFTFDINPSANPDIGSGKLDGEGIPADFFKDRDLRKGFAYAFDYEAFLKDTFRGVAQRAKGPIPPGLPGSDPAQPFYARDPAKAAEHFKKAWGGKVWEKGFKFTLTYNTGGDVREYSCNILKKTVEALNPKFKIDVRGVEWASYLDKAQRHLMPVFSRGWTADYPDAHNFVFPFYHSQGRYASAQGYRNPELDKKVEAAVREVDPVKRAKLYKDILRLGYEEVPSIQTVHPPGVYGLREWVKGFYDNAVFMGIYFYPLSK